ncbi:MAG: SbtA family thio(seleno)oxazole RiPP natural product precursor [Desulfobulbaceae bacterium]|nr:SbtA family thio(seleno)oxazole RiPP natural product precursor [Desulfobulbaceae bacterium]
MDAKEMKKILAGVGIAGLLSGLPLTSGVAFGGSGCGAKGDSSMKTDKTEAVGAGSGCSGHKGSAATTTQEETGKDMGAAGDEEKAMAAPKDEEQKKMAPAGSSGCSGSK